MRLGWEDPVPGPGTGTCWGAGSGPSCTLHLTWLISLAENWMALLPTGLGRGGKRRRRALGRGVVGEGVGDGEGWGGGGGSESRVGVRVLPSPLFAQLVDGGHGGESE